MTFRPMTEDEVTFTEPYPGIVYATDDDTYDGPGSPIGVGSTIAEALESLNARLEERYDPDEECDVFPTPDEVSA